MEGYQNLGEFDFNSNSHVYVDVLASLWAWKSVILIYAQLENDFENKDDTEQQIQVEVKRCFLND